MAGVLGQRLTEAGQLSVVATAALHGEGREAILEATVQAYAKWNRRCVICMCVCDCAAQLLRPA